MRKMKDSGIEWIGEIPEGWEVIPNKRIMTREKVICERYTNELVLSLTMNGVIVRDLDNPTGKMPLTFDGYQYVHKGNLLMCLFDIDVTPRCVGVINNNGVTSPAYSQFILNSKANVQYYYYYYLNLDFTKELLHLAKNLRHSLTESQLGEIPIPLPPLSEQERIADYLDEKCGRIDAAIEKQKQVIEKLQEYKRSLITQTVTKGLNPKAKMKDSGIEWIGEIPEGWEVRRLKYIIRIVSGDAIRNEDLDPDGEYPVYGGGEPIGYCNRFNIDKNCLVVGRVGARCGCIIKTTSKSWATDNALILYDVSYVDYLYYSLISANLNHLNTSNAQPLITATKVLNKSIAYPPLSEQRQIADYLDERCASIDSVIAKKSALIEKLTEYKKSLIYETVTGKREI